MSETNVKTDSPVANFNSGLATAGTDEAQCCSKPPLKCHDITSEQWRQYQWICPATGKLMRHRIDAPKSVYLYVGCKTHRVVDMDGIAHCVPSVGMYGCVLLWKTKPGLPPVTF